MMLFLMQVRGQLTSTLDDNQKLRMSSQSSSMSEAVMAINQNSEVKSKMLEEDLKRKMNSSKRQCEKLS